jgi:hypothetical protein
MAQGTATLSLRDGVRQVNAAARVALADHDVVLPVGLASLLERSLTSAWAGSGKVFRIAKQS